MNKAHILQEIKRTATENGGKPLGRHRFATETGIRESDWLGTLWVRWGDALREAGFTPNQFQAAFDKTALLEKYAGLALEFGRLPTGTELQLKAHTDPEFPSATTFKNQLGVKTELVQQVLDYCRGRNGYEEVIRLCEKYVPRDQPARDGADENDTEVGFVYLVKSGRFYKIGKSNAFGRREYELAIQLPEKAIRVHVIRTDDPSGIEEYWHKRFEAKRKNGEWFELDATDIAAFKRRKFM